MRNTLFCGFAFLISLSVVAMDADHWTKPGYSWPHSDNVIPAFPVSAPLPAKPVSGGALLASLGSQDDLFKVVSYDTSDPQLNVSDELNKDFAEFLRHISVRVVDIHKEINAYNDPRNDIRDVVAASFWSFASSKLRVVQALVKNPTSENMAITLIKKIDAMNEMRKSNADYDWQIELETQELVVTVQGQISGLLNRYKHMDESAFIRTQLEYLVEYKERIHRVNELMGGSLK